MTLEEIHKLSPEEAYFMGVQEGKKQFDLEAYKLGWINGSSRLESALLEVVTGKANQGRIRFNTLEVQDNIVVKKKGGQYDGNN